MPSLPGTAPPATSAATTVTCCVAMIRACQRVGLSIAEIRTALAELPEGHVPGPADWDRLAQRLRHELRHRIDDLNRARRCLA